MASTVTEEGLADVLEVVVVETVSEVMVSLNLNLLLHDLAVRFVTGPDTWLLTTIIAWITHFKGVSHLLN